MSESTIRRQLNKLGLYLKKTPSRSHLRDWYGPGFMVVDGYTNTVVLGCFHRAYDATLDEVVAFVAERKAA